MCYDVSMLHRDDSSPSNFPNPPLSFYCENVNL